VRRGTRERPPGDTHSKRSLPLRAATQTHLSTPHRGRLKGLKPKVVGGAYLRECTTGGAPGKNVWTRPASPDTSPRIRRWKSCES
jgi:hypothetical protein